jgi:hypothetical protein
MSPLDNREAGRLTRELYFTFELKRYKKGQDLLVQIKKLENAGKYGKGLQTICQFLVKEFCKYKQAPLWGLKYCDIEWYPDDKKASIILLIDNIYRLNENDKDYISVVKETNKIMDIYRFDLYVIFNDMYNYRQGFKNYLTHHKAIEPYITEREYIETLQYIKQNIKTPIYLWTEQDVLYYFSKFRVMYEEDHIIVTE